MMSLTCLLHGQSDVIVILYYLFVIILYLGFRTLHVADQNENTVLRNTLYDPRIGMTSLEQRLTQLLNYTCNFIFKGT